MNDGIENDIGVGDLDLGDIKPGTREVAITHPATGEDLGLVFILRSSHHPDVIKVERDWQNSRLRKRNIDITVEQFEAIKIKTLAAHVESWRWDDPKLKLNGEQPEYSVRACREMLRDHLWIREWLDRETGNASRFYEGSEAN